LNAQVTVRSAGQQYSKRAFRANVLRLDPVQVLFGFHCRSDCHEAVEAARIVGSIFVLRPTVHTFLIKKEVVRYYAAERFKNVILVTKSCEIIHNLLTLLWNLKSRILVLITPQLPARTFPALRK
jgi:hypothetical protein